MNKILWYLTNKLDASSPPPLPFIFKTLPVVSRSDVISMCIQLENQLNWKRKGLRNRTVSFYWVLVFHRSLFLKVRPWGQHPASLRLIRNPERLVHQHGLDGSLLTRSLGDSQCMSNKCAPRQTTQPSQGARSVFLCMVPWLWRRDRRCGATLNSTDGPDKRDKAIQHGRHEVMAEVNLSTPQNAAREAPCGLTAPLPGRHKNEKHLP